MTQEQKYNLALALISQGVTNLNDVQNFIDGLDLNHEQISVKGSVLKGRPECSTYPNKEAGMTINCPKEHQLNILNLVQKYSLDKGLGKIEIDGLI